MNRWDIVNRIINKEKYHSYFEIGYGTGLTFEKILIDRKIGIDTGFGVPDKTKCFIGDVQSFFRQNPREIFDIIFIDGSHLFEDVLVDAYASLDHLSDNGTIVFHDCNPPSKNYQKRKYVRGYPGWNGDVWKAFLYLKTTREDLNMFVVDTDYGCGIAKRKAELAKSVSKNTDIVRRISAWIFRIRNTYENLEKNRTFLLGLITTKDFEDLYR
ncbi:MAG: class I SAM-dependent methyltransferase [Verrucomicrobia bacterium]|nr:class I SAM-dependent methyltransferase [Verrucomicrobiota bacterium]